jgi:hypothetical protein
MYVQITSIAPLAGGIGARSVVKALRRESVTAVAGGIRIIGRKMHGALRSWQRRKRRPLLLPAESTLATGHYFSTTGTIRVSTDYWMIPATFRLESRLTEKPAFLVLKSTSI